MSRRLILMRHAKSSWDTPGLRDFDRPLNKRGRRGAERIGEWLLAKGFVPEAGLVSAAVRTRETWDRLGPVFAAVPMRADPGLFHASPEAMLSALRAAPEAAGSVLMLGHQPGIGEFAARLLAEPPTDADFLKYPTAATGVIDFEVDDWASVGWGGGRLVDFVTPRALE